ncbi:MAG: aspartyl protease family protein [Oceanicaulis sp.]
MIAIALSALLAAQAAPSVTALQPTVEGRLSTGVMIDGRGPWPFIVDTGASHTAIAEPLAVEFGFVPTGDLTEVQTLTDRVQSERLTLGRVEAAGAVSETINAVVVAAPTDLDLAIFGLLGNDMFEGRTIALDTARAELRLDVAAPRFADAQMHPERNVPVTRVELRRAGEPVYALIDTGSARTIINRRLERRIRPPAGVVRYLVESATKIAREEEEARLARLDELRIGGLCPRSLAVIAADVDVFRAMGWSGEPAILLGLDALEGAVLTIDHATGVVEISPADGERCG